MANRVLGSEVKEIIKTVLTELEVAPMITAANLLVTAKCSTAGYSSAELKEIERWLAAHFVSVRDPSGSVSEKKVGEASEKYQRGSKAQAKEALEGTPYGQQALILDYRGCLTDLGRKQVSIRAFGALNDESDDD
jgi:hypothetical protein